MNSIHCVFSIQDRTRRSQDLNLVLVQFPKLNSVLLNLIQFTKSDLLS